MGGGGGGGGGGGEAVSVESLILRWLLRPLGLLFKRRFQIVRTCCRFYLTTVEAAVEHIRGGSLQKEAIKSYSLKVNIHTRYNDSFPNDYCDVGHYRNISCIY